MSERITYYETLSKMTDDGGDPLYPPLYLAIKCDIIDVSELEMIKKYKKINKLNKEEETNEDEKKETNEDEKKETNEDEEGLKSPF